MTTVAISVAACSLAVEVERPTATTTMAQVVAVTQDRRPTVTSTAPTVTVTPSATATLGPTHTPGPVNTSVAKTVYRQGEPVEFTITNRLARTIFWVYGGCAWPVPVYVQGNERTLLQISIWEALPPIGELQPGQAVTCVWDQQAYSVPGRNGLSGHPRQVPAGQYQFRLSYSFSEEEAETKPRLTSEPPIIYSPLFTIEEK